MDDMTPAELEAGGLLDFALEDAAARLTVARVRHRLAVDEYTAAARRHEELLAHRRESTRAAARRDPFAAFAAAFAAVADLVGVHHQPQEETRADHPET